LIFSGKILKDQDTLIQHGIKDGVTVHLVIKANKPNEPAQSSSSSSSSTSTSASGAQQPSSQSTTTTSAPGSGTSQPNNLFNLPFGGGLGGSNFLNNLGAFGMGNSNFAEIQAQMQQQVMSNPDMMRQMLDNPMIQSLMSNPDVIRDLMMSNPQMQNLVEVYLNFFKTTIYSDSKKFKFDFVSYFKIEKSRNSAYAQ
jgi:ubiquilin